MILAVGASVGAFAAARRLATRLGGHPLANPVLVAALLLAALLAMADVPPADYASAARPLTWCLGPAIVALAMPLADAALRAEGRRLSLALAIVAGAATGVASAVGLARLLGLPPELVAAAATRSVTAGVAAVTTQALGGSVPLAVALSIVSGLIGALALPPLLARLGLGGDREMGTAVGLAAHIIGTDALVRRAPGAVPHAALAMAAAGLLTGLALPLLAS